jgi:3-oxoacyl-[acyl-carrier protein] reductase
MANRGCQIILVARDQDKLDLTLSELNKDNNHSSVRANFDRPDELKENISIALKSLNKPVDILVNNSGGPHGGPLIEANEDEFRIAFERLLICNHILAKAVVPGMKEMKCGRIINIISTSIRQVIAGLGVSNTIRGSVAQWGKSLALELGEFGITVNNVLPGYTSTSRLKELAKNKSKSTGISEEDLYELWGSNTSLKRLGVPEEIAEGIAFLASDGSSYITGHNLSIDGGRFGGA